ncbi:MAG: DUF4397 domain-containing protein [Actinobacteria bacterium]|nr:DUF4397 domain-containing protein [Actinomycetota bacterium]
MRYKILSGLAVGLLATVGVAAPAQAISSTSSDVYVVHGIPGVVVDVYVNDALTLEDFTFGAAGVAGPLDLAAGDYKIQVVPAGGNPATDSVIDVPAAAVPANKSVSLVAQYDAAGDYKLGVYVNDISTIAAGQGRVTVRHAAEAGAVAVVVNGANPFGADFENGEEFKADLPVGDYTAGVAGPGTTTPIIIPTSGTAADIALAEGVNLIVYAVGTGDELQLITQSISGLHSNPGGVNTGSAGLAADNNPTVIGLSIAAALALLLVAGFAGARVRSARETD